MHTTMLKVMHKSGVGAIVAIALQGLVTANAVAEDPTAPLVKPGETIPVTVIPGGVFLRVPNDPQEILWERVPEYQVQLVPAPFVHASTELRKDNVGAPVPLFFSIASDRERLYVKLRWVDTTPDQEMRSDHSRDGAAVQFALDPDAQTSHMMGSPELPVNIWYWHADSDQAESLGAGGFGSATTLEAQPVSARSHYRTARLADDNQWTLVMSRPLDIKGEYSARFEPGAVQSLAFAVWDGAAGQRDGLKRTTPGWIKVDFGPLLKAG